MTNSTNAASSDPPLTPEQIAAAELRAAREGYIHRALVGADQFMATLFGAPNDETMSSEIEIAAHKRVWWHRIAAALNEGLDLLQASHGQRAQAGDIARAEKAAAIDAAAIAQETGSLSTPSAMPLSWANK